MANGFTNVDPSSLTKEQLGSFLDLIRLGNPSGDVADYVKKQEVLNDPCGNFDPEYGLFFRKTTAQGEEILVAVVNGWGESQTVYVYNGYAWLRSEFELDILS